MDTEALEDDVGLSTLDQEANKEADGLVKASSTRFLSPVILCILVMETAERCVFYGFRALLVLYFTRQLSFSDSTAIALVSYNNCLTYLTPLMDMLMDMLSSWGKSQKYCWLVYSPFGTLMTLLYGLSATLLPNRKMRYWVR